MVFLPLSHPPKGGNKIEASNTNPALGTHTQTKEKASTQCECLLREKKRTTFIIRFFFL